MSISATSTTASTIHQVIGTDGTPYPATGCFNPWIGHDGDVFAMPRDGNRITPLISGADYFGDLIKACDAASNEVMIMGWQVNWDALLAPGVRLYDVVYRNAQRGVRFYLMPWDDTNPLQTYDDQTRIVLTGINERLGLGAKEARVHVLLSGSMVTTNVLYFSHHQKCVIVDRKVAYVGGLDLAYGRYDTATYPLKADADGRRVLNRYNNSVPWIKSLKSEEVIDPDRMSGAEWFGTKSDTRKRVRDGGFQVPYEPNLAALNKHGTDKNTMDLHTLDERIQPRLPWQDVHVRIEGPAVSDLLRNFAMRWNIGATPRLPVPHGYDYRNMPKPGGARIQVLRSAARTCAPRSTKRSRARRKTASAPRKAPKRAFTTRCCA